jgi:pyruvate/2-oxoglutarate dehydrogenase complex dihydrolipoamide dehydrogenase (E3) component
VNVNGKLAVIGGGLVGGETANHLATHDNQVTIIEMLPEIIREEPGSVKKFMMESYAEHGVDIQTSAAVQTINEDQTITVRIGEEERILGPFDAVITAVGLHANTELQNVLEDVVPEVVYVGGALHRGNALDAIREGYAAALRI